MKDIIVISKEDLSGIVDKAVTNAIERSQPVPRTEKQWLTNPEAMEYLGLSRTTMQRYREAGIFPFTKVESNIYYRFSDIEKALKERRLNRKLKPVRRSRENEGV